MEAGRLNMRVLLQAPTQTVINGEVISSYSDVMTVWAYIKSEWGKEAFESARNEAREIIRICIRWRSDITTDWRLVWMGKTFSISRVDITMKQKGELWLTAMAKGI